MAELVERDWAMKEIEFWENRAKHYRDMIFDLMAKMMEGVKFNSVEWTADGITWKEKQSGWIPVSERLPEIDMSYPHHEDYLVQWDSGGMDVASWSNVNRFWTDHVTEPYWNCVQFAKVIAWMPLPPSYKKEQE